MTSSPPKIVMVTGATAVGKSAFAVALAQRIGGEIINADAMQLYRKLDIGTAKLSLAEQGGVPHHLLDCADIHDEIDVFWYIRAAEAKIHDILNRGHIPVFCGGTGYYLKSLLYGLDDLPGDSVLRTALDAQFDSAQGEIALRAEMSARDPADLEKYGSNRRKLIRAWEVFLLSGRPMSEQVSAADKSKKYQDVTFNLVRDRSVLRERIFKRTHLMLVNGWIEETQCIIADGFMASPTARQAIGYRIIADYLNGGISFEETENLIATRTWQYARRQMTWFAHQHPGNITLNADQSESDFQGLFSECFGHPKQSLLK